MEPVLGRVTRYAAAAAMLLGSGFAAHAAFPIAEDELYGFLAVFSDSFTGCDVNAVGGLFSPGLTITFVDSGRTEHPSRAAYLESLRELCRVESPERGFKVVSSSTSAGGAMATMGTVITKQYQLGLVKRRRIEVTLHQELSVGRAARGRLEVTKLYERSEYRDLSQNGELIPCEDARPFLPLNRLQRMLLGSWLLPADREGSQDSHAHP